MFIFLVLLFIVLWAVWIRARLKTRLNLPPLYPGAWPILGHAGILRFGIGDTTHLWRVAQEMSQVVTKNGGVMRATIAFSDYYIITDPEDMLTAVNACLDKPACYEFSKCWLGNGLITGNAAIWKRHRKLINPSFNQQILDSFIHIFNTQAKILVTNLESKVGEGYFHHFPYLDQMTLETVYQTAIGINCDDNTKLDKKAFTDAEHEMLNIISKRFQNVWLHSDFIFNLTSLKKRQDELLKVINNTHRAVMDMKKSIANKDKNTTGKKIKAFMDLLLDLAADGSLSNEEVWEEVNTIIVAGHDTTATSLMLLLVILGSHQEVQEKISEELREVFDNSSRDVTRNDLPKLIYMEAVIKEALRMYPLGVALLKYATEDVRLKKYTIPAKSNCIMLVHGLHRHPVWGEDADKFRPERWLEDDGGKTNAFGGFGLGKRNCIGRTYAMILLKTSLTHFLRRYRVTADITKMEFKIDVILKASSGDVISIEEKCL